MCVLTRQKNLLNAAQRNASLKIHAYKNYPKNNRNDDDDYDNETLKKTITALNLEKCSFLEMGIASSVHCHIKYRSYWIMVQIRLSLTLPT